MDFNLLDPVDLNEFLSTDYSDYHIYVDENLTPVEQGGLLFQQLKDIGGVYFPLPIVDLYLASIFSKPIDGSYTYDQIMNMPYEDVLSWANEFGFDPSLNNEETNRDRIYRILSYLGYVFEYQPERLLDLAVLEQICQNLSLDDLNTFRIVNQLPELTCQININDPNKLITSIPYLNSQTYKWAKQIEVVGGETFTFNSGNQGDLDAIKFAIESGFDPNTRPKNGVNLLQLASYLGNLELAKLLIEKGADVNFKVNTLFIAAARNVKNKKSYPIIIALQHNHLDIVKLLIDNGADLNVRSFQDPLIGIASKEGHYDLVQTILETVGDKLDDRDKRRAFVEAAENGHLDIVKLLIEHGLDFRSIIDHEPSDYHLINIIDAGGYGLVLAASKGKLDMIDYLVSLGVDVNYETNDSKTALLAAVLNNEIKAVNLLLNLGADINYETNDSKTALLAAVLNSGVETVNLLLDRGADINQGFPLLKVTKQLNSSFMLRHMAINLILKGADVNVEDDSGNTPLIYAITYKAFINSRKEELIKLLIEYGADIHHQNDDGSTALSLAKMYPSIEELLVRKGASS